jgi:hypothetical protein
MSDRPTPETDQFKVKFKTVCGEKYWVPVDIARKLERERDEARDALMRIEDLFLDGTDIYADREKMYLIAREALEETK